MRVKTRGEERRGEERDVNSRLESADRVGSNWGCSYSTTHKEAYSRF